MEQWLETEDGQQFPLQGNCSIGRLPENTLAINDKEVSRRHALIHAQGEGVYYLVDLGSRNGSLLNGQRIRMPMQLKDMDTIQVSSTILTFRQTESAEEFEDEEAMATIAASNTAKSGDCWLLVADIVSFTKLSQQMGQDEMAQMVGKWILACKQIIERNRGFINKYLGDGFLAFWPLDVTPAETIAQALHELRELQNGQDMQFRVVVHYGTVRVDSAVSAGEDNLIGPEVNFAFRMEKVCGALGQFCLFSEPAAQQLQEFMEIYDEGTHALKGFQGEHAFYSALPNPQ
ncbi:MAG: adenylate/guanylate cyclase domain-containing protein [Deltaproteobacteria bacterium]|nr:MAG: adenylate/guanylate cyclase domain-containing protein [Deltaproteobacteria bacterium]